MTSPLADRIRAIATADSLTAAHDLAEALADRVERYTAEPDNARSCQVVVLYDPELTPDPVTCDQPRPCAWHDTAIRAEMAADGLTAEQHIRIQAGHIASHSQAAAGCTCTDDLLDVGDALADWIRDGSRA